MRVLLVYLEFLDNEPIGLMYIGTVLKKAGHTVTVIGLSKHRAILEFISKFKPDIVGFTVPTVFANQAQSISRRIKDSFPKIITIAGGPHPSALPFETLSNNSIDICVMGEGEITVIDLLQALESSRPLGQVKGIAFLKDGKLVVTDSRDYVQDLDTLPFVDRELLSKNVIHGSAGYPLGNPCAFIMVGRGCPYQCSFCQPGIDKIFGRKIRRRSPENVIEEIIYLKKKYGIHGLWINDDTFLMDDNWIDRFCNLMIKNRLDILWYANGRINNVNKDILIKMREAGCAVLVLTPETGSQRVRNDVLNKNISNEEIERAYKICHEINLPTQANIMLGSPTETEEELEMSIALIRKIQPYFMNNSYTTALPATYLYEKYYGDIIHSDYYRSFEDYDIRILKKLNNNIEDSKLIASRRYFDRLYGNCSFSNRARHFFRFPHFRRILYKRWKTLIFSRHPKFRHFLFDILAILMGSFVYFRNRNLYDDNNEK